MKRIIQKTSIITVLSCLTIFVFIITSCQKGHQSAQPAQTNSSLHSNLSPGDLASAVAQTGAVAQTDYVYLLGEEPIIEGPDKTVAPNGDTLTFEGSGTLSIHPKSVTGTGRFEHTDAAGNLLARGTWDALELLSFKSFGTPGPPFDPSLEAGLALIRIHLSPDAGGAGFDAILQIYCVLPSPKVPPGFEEGINLVVQGVINFNKQVSGQTVFIRQSSN